MAQREALRLPQGLAWGRRYRPRSRDHMRKSI